MHDRFQKGKVMDMSARKGGTVAGAITMIAELAELNLLTLLLCLPVITAGASLTAMHAVLQKMVRNEEGYIGRMFFAAFRANLKKATLEWLPFLMIYTALIADYLIVEIDITILPKGIIMAATIAGIISFLIMQFVFPLQAHFENSVRGTLSGAAVLAVVHFPKTFLMAAVGILPLILGLMLIFALPFVLVFGLAAPGYVAARIYDPIFQKLEESDS